MKNTQSFVASRSNRERLCNGLLIVSIALSIIFCVFGILEQQQADLTSIKATGQVLTAQADRTDVIENLSIAQTNERLARSKELAALARLLAAQTSDRSRTSVAQSRNRFDLSLLLSVEAFNLNDNFQTRDALLNVLFTFPFSRKYLAGHADRVDSVDISPDGKVVASGSLDGTIIFWDVATGKSLGKPITVPGRWMGTIAFSPDGKTLVSGGSDRNAHGTILFWDVKTHEAVGQSLTDPSLFHAAFSPDGKNLAAWGSNKIVLFDLVNYQPIGQPLTMSVPDGSIYSIAFSPDGKTLVSGSGGFSYRGDKYSTVTLWDLAAGKLVWQKLNAHNDPVAGIAFSPDGKILASSGGGDIKFWYAKTGTLMCGPLKTETDILSLAFAPDGKTLASSNGDGTIVFWNTIGCASKRQTLIGHTTQVNSIAFSSDGKTLVSGSSDRSVIVWDLTPGQPIGKSLVGHIGDIGGFAFSSNGEILASWGMEDNTVILWNVKTGKRIGAPLLVEGSGVTDVDFSPDGKILAAGTVDGSVTLWNVSTRKLITSLKMKTKSSRADLISFSPNGKVLAAGTFDGTLILWNTATYQRSPLLTAIHTMLDIAFSPDSETLAAVGSDISLFDVATRTRLGDPLNRDLYDKSSGNVWSVAFSPDGKILATGNEEDTVFLWDVKTRISIGKPLVGRFEMAGYGGPVDAVEFSADGKTLTVNSRDIILWDLATRLPTTQPITDFDYGLRKAALSSDGKYLAASRRDGTIILFNLDPKSLIERACSMARRNLTRMEWIQYGFNEPYHATCPQWALETEATPAPIATP